MFRRTKTAPEGGVVTTDASPATSMTDPTRAGGKGRPTPTRKEAEAAARARAKTPRTRKELAAAQRALRSESSKKMREALKTGDDRYLPSRDKGPVRRFVRDFIDSRFSFIELMIPMMILTLALGYSGNKDLQVTGNLILMATLVMVVLDIVFMRYKVRRQVEHRFPGVPTKGLTYYAVMRALQMKFMRLPKPQVRIGDRLPEQYR